MTKMDIWMDEIPVSEHLLILPGAVNTGVLRLGAKALLFDCCATITPERLAELGITQVALVCCTQPRLPNIAGSYAFTAQGAALVVPEQSRDLYEQPERYWTRWSSRWESMKFQPVPQVPVTPFPVVRVVSDGDIIEWEGFSIQVLEMPGPIQGSLAFLVEVDGKRCCFSGDYLYGPGQIWELYPLQETYADCHGFMANPNKLEASLHKLWDCGASVLIPSHGLVMDQPAAAIQQTLERIQRVQDTYRITLTGDAAMCMENPLFIRKVLDTTSFLVVSETGDALLVDAGDDMVLWELLKLKAEGVFNTLSAIYITHYHCDHLWAIGHILFHFPLAEVIVDEHLTDVVRHPGRYHLPCVSHRLCPLARSLKDGESWQWQEFTLSNYHFPGQTYYHDALLVEGHGQRILLTGDSLGAGMWLPDYCAGNRNFLGEDEGFFRCLRLVRELQPDLIVEGHGGSFRWNEEQREEKLAAFSARVSLLQELVPWEHASFGVDEGWATTFPYEQEVRPGLIFRVDVKITNHALDDALALASPVLPDGWKLNTAQSETGARIPARSEGNIPFYVTVPEDAPAGQYIIPMRITWNGRYLGQYRHAMVTVYQ